MHRLPRQYVLGRYRRRLFVVVCRLHCSRHQSQWLISMLCHPSYPCSNLRNDCSVFGTFCCTYSSTIISYRRANASSCSDLCNTDRHWHHSHRSKHRKLPERLHRCCDQRLRRAGDSHQWLRRSVTKTTLPARFRRHSLVHSDLIQCQP